ncbi:MAG: hypothetical protein HFJ24_07325 [Clostridia bacterium]|nr:hypothetical protein [Clostridia bacterium]MCI9275729.1 hypothetical protein [Clostridia bacterium]
MKLRNKLKDEKGLGLPGIIILALILILIVVIVVGGTKSVRRFIDKNKEQQPDALTKFEQMNVK